MKLHIKRLESLLEILRLLANDITMVKMNGLETFIKLLDKNFDQSGTNDSNVVPLYDDLDKGGWTYVVFNFPIDGGAAKIVMDDDESVARQTYADMNVSSLDRLIMLVQMSKRLCERLYLMNDIASITEMIASFRSERKILLCNKTL